MTQPLLFDLDGTLIDLSDDLTRALNAAFAEDGFGALPREQVEPLIKDDCIRSRRCGDSSILGIALTTWAISC